MEIYLVGNIEILYLYVLLSIRYARTNVGLKQHMYYDSNKYRQPFSQQHNSTMLDTSYMNEPASLQQHHSSLLSSTRSQYSNHSEQLDKRCPKSAEYSFHLVEKPITRDLTIHKTHKVFVDNYLH